MTLVSRPSEYTPEHDRTPAEASDVFVLPASFAQERLWFLDQLEPGRPAYNVPFNFRLSGGLQVDALAAALAFVVERHETLRTVFELRDGAPVQVILPAAPIPLPIEDLRSLDAATRDDALAHHVAHESALPFDLAAGPVLRARLLRLADEEHLLLLTIHHIAVDGWSLGVLQRELGAAYAALLAGQQPALPELEIQYSDFAVWQREQLGTTELEQQIQYWRQCLAAPLPAFDLPTDRPRIAGRERIADTAPLELSAATTNALLALGREAGVTPFVVLLAAFQALLHRYTGDEDVIVGSPVAGRTQRETEGLIGLFVNTLALRTDLSGAPSFRQLLDRARGTVHAALAHHDVPFERVVGEVHPDRDQARTPIFQTLFSFQDFGSGTPVTMPGLVVSRVAGVRGVAKVDLQLIMNQRADSFRGTLEYDASLLDADSARRMMTHFVTLVDGMAAAPDRPIGELSLLTPAERELVVSEWNRTETPYPRDARVDELFAAEVARRPEAVAVRSGGHALTYGRLDEAAEALAARLVALGIRPGDRVGLCVDRSIAMVVATLAVLKSGAVYVPLDPGYPAERLGFMLGDTAATVILSQRRLAGTIEEVRTLVEAPPPVLFVDDLGRLENDQPPGATADSKCTPAADSLSGAAYVMYTSGSTGRPKGVVVPHRAIVRLVRNTNFLTFTEQDVVLGFAPSAFDASTLEIWGPLLNGGQLVLAPAGPFDVVALGDLVESAGITTLWLTAALFHQVVEGGLARYGKVRNLLAGGDVLSPADVRRVLAELPQCTLINGYGPTENTTFTCCYPVPRDWRGEGSVPIGRPIANTHVYVLDARGAPVPVGVPGELYAGGDGVALGYLGRPELTAERFVADPFAPGRASADASAARLYRTGDRVRWRSDGTVEFLGRLDQQVKIRGFRVEPGEIEAVLAGHPAVSDAAVVALAESGGDVRLVGYFVPREGTDAEGAAAAPLTPASIRAYLRDRLPEHMVPTAFVSMTALPIGATGKLDRRALPAPDASSAGGGRAYVPPRSTLEHQFVQTFESLLDARPIGIQDDFFDLGGHSLLAVRMLAEMERVTGRRLPLSSLFESATIEHLAVRLEKAMHDEAEPPFVVLNPNGRDRPIVFVHGDVTGGGWYCRRLAPLLEMDAPIYVLPTLRGVEPGAPASIEEMARFQLGTVRTFQMTGPYRLVGYCAGGAIAFEMARLLVDAGETVERLVLIDSVAANARFKRLEWMVSLVANLPGRSLPIDRRAEFLRKMVYYSSRLRAVRRSDRRERWQWVVKNVQARMPGLEVAERALDPQSEALMHAPDFEARPMLPTLRFQSRAARAYIPGAYRGTVDLVVGVDPNCDPAMAEVLSRGRRGWERVAREVRVHAVASSHVGLITDQVALLAERLRECLVPRSEA